MFCCYFQKAGSQSPQNASLNTLLKGVAVTSLLTLFVERGATLYNLLSLVKEVCMLIVMKTKDGRDGVTFSHIMSFTSITH